MNNSSESHPHPDKSVQDDFDKLSRAEDATWDFRINEANLKEQAGREDKKLRR